MQSLSEYVWLEMVHPVQLLKLQFQETTKLLLPTEFRLTQKFRNARHAPLGVPKLVALSDESLDPLVLQ